jgi:hypothetical protein
MTPEEADQAAEAAEAYRVEAERVAEQLAMVVVMSSEPEREERLASALAAATVISVLAALWPDGETPPELERVVAEAGHRVAEEALETIEKVAGESAQALSDIPAERRAWARSVGTTLAARAASAAAIALAPAVSAHLDSIMRKLWVTRGDSRVRESHRLLHARTADIDSPFQAPGVTMMYPGDPAAPIEEWINCRCGLMLVKDDDSSAAEDALHMEPAEFDVGLAASGAVAARAEANVTSDIARRALSVLCT